MSIAWQRLATESHRDQSGLDIIRLCPGWSFYCETPKATADGKRFAVGADGFYVCDLATMSLARFDDYVDMVNSSYKDWVYTLHPASGPDWSFDVWRFDMQTLERRFVIAVRGAPSDGARGHGPTISPDGRYMLYQRDAKDGSELVRVDLQSGTWSVIFRHPSLLRHLQYEPNDGSLILVQQNRPLQTKPPQPGDPYPRPGGESGAKHFIISADGAHTYPLPVGEPHTFRCSGHSSFIGKTHRIVCATDWSHAAGNPADPPPDWELDPRYPQASLFTAGPGDENPVPFNAPEHRFFHVTASLCGKYVALNSTPKRKGPVELVIANLVSGKYRTAVHDCLCYTGSVSPSSLPYLTADLRYLIYRAKIDPNIAGDTGWYVFAARLTDEFLAGLE